MMFQFCCISIQTLLQPLLVQTTLYCNIDCVLTFVVAQKMMLLGRFLVQSTHLLPSEPRPARIQLISDLPRNRCPDSENQDTIDNNLQRRYLQLKWQQLSGSLNSLVPTLCNGFPLPSSHPPHQHVYEASGTYQYNIFDLNVFISCLDKVFIHTCQIIFNLCCHPFPLCFCFIFFSI